MNDTERCAHDLAIAYIQEYPPVLDKEAVKYPEDRMNAFVAYYEDVYETLKIKINKK